MKVSEKNFELKKLKKRPNNDGGLEIHYSIVTVVADETYKKEVKVTTQNIPHPDLMEAFKKLKPKIAEVFNNDEENLEVRGISHSGEEKNEGIVITGLFTINGGYKVAVNTHKIKYVGTAFSWEEELRDVYQELRKEAYKYLFEDKQAQLTAELD